MPSSQLLTCPVNILRRFMRVWHIDQPKCTTKDHNLAHRTSSSSNSNYPIPPLMARRTPVNKWVTSQTLLDTYAVAVSRTAKIYRTSTFSVFISVFALLLAIDHAAINYPLACKGTFASVPAWYLHVCYTRGEV